MVLLLLFFTPSTGTVALPEEIPSVWSTIAAPEEFSREKSHPRRRHDIRLQNVI